MNAQPFGKKLYRLQNFLQFAGWESQQKEIFEQKWDHLYITDV